MQQTQSRHCLLHHNNRLLLEKLCIIHPQHHGLLLLRSFLFFTVETDSISSGYITYPAKFQMKQIRNEFAQYHFNIWMHNMSIESERSSSSVYPLLGERFPLVNELSRVRCVFSFLPEKASFRHGPQAMRAGSIRPDGHEEIVIPHIELLPFISPLELTGILRHTPDAGREPHSHTMLGLKCLIGNVLVAWAEAPDLERRRRFCGNCIDDVEIGRAGERHGRHSKQHGQLDHERHNWERCRC